MNSLRWEWQQVSEWLSVKEREGLRRRRKTQKWNESKGNLISISVRRNKKCEKKTRAAPNKVNTIRVVGVRCTCVHKRRRDKWMKDRQTWDSCYRWRKADNRYASSNLHRAIGIGVAATATSKAQGKKATASDGKVNEEKTSTHTHSERRTQKAKHEWESTRIKNAIKTKNEEKEK